MSSYVEALIACLNIKERLLKVSLEDGSFLERDNPEFLQAIHSAHCMVLELPSGASRDKARRILGHIRQFNPFNTSDVDENEFLEKVVEDFLGFTQDQISHLKS